MRIELIDDLDLPLVTNPKYKEKNKFHPEGIFSEQIFGPVESYKCWCDHVKVQPGEVCPDCGIKITSNSARRTTFAAIDIGRAIHPIIMELLNSFVKFKTISNQLLSGKAYLDPNDKIQIVEDVLSVADDPNNKFGIDAIYQFVLNIVNQPAAAKSVVLTYLKEMIDAGKFFTNKVVVIPPDLRPAMLSLNSLDELNKLYIALLTYTSKAPTLQNPKVQIAYESTIQKLLLEMNKFVFDKIGKKSGLLRNKLAGKRVDFSARAVITVEPTIPITHVKVSRFILAELFKIELAAELKSQKKFVTFKSAMDYVTENIEHEELEEDLKKLVDKVSTNQLVILNRQPTLHKGSMLGFRIIPQDGYAISINPMIVESLNADFDGDQVAIYRPLKNQSKKEVEKMLASSNLFDPSDGSLHFVPKQDITYGIYKISQSEEGRKMLSKVFGEEIISELPLKKLVSILSKKADYTLLDSVKEIGSLNYTAQNPTSLSLEDFEQTQVVLTGNREEDSKLLSETTESIKQSFVYKDIINSGARGSWDQVKQMIVARGYVSNFFGEIVPVPVKQSYLNGLSPEEFFISAYGCRKGLLDVAENTAQSGYLTRRLIYATTSAILGDEDDCGTKRTLKIDVDNEKLAESLKYRYYYLEDPLLVDSTPMFYVENANEIMGKTIYLRSPITCENPKICKKCYGGLANINKTKYIGVIAAQSLGERSTQLVLRTFHTSGVASSKDLKKQKDIASDIEIVAKNTDVTLKVNSLKDVIDYTIDLFDIYKNYGNMHLVHFEVIQSQRLRNDTNKKLRLEKDMTFPARLVTIRQIPVIESWFLGIIFQDVRTVTRGLFTNSKSMSILEKIALGGI